MRGNEEIIVGHHLTLKYLISINDYLQTCKELKDIQNSLEAVPLASLTDVDRRQKKAFFFEHVQMTQTFCKWKRGGMKPRILIS